MSTRLAMLPILWLVTACTSVASIHPMVADGAAIAEPRLLGDWQLIQGGDTTLIQVTQKTSPSGPVATEYLLRSVSNNSDTIRLVGRLGPFGPGTWVFEVTPASASDWDRYNGLVLPGYMQVVVRRTAGGLDFLGFDTDSLKAALESGRLRTPYIRSGGHDDKIFLTSESAALRTALVNFSARPGVLVPVSRAGHVLSLPDDH